MDAWWTNLQRIREQVGQRGGEAEARSRGWLHSGYRNPLGGQGDQGIDDIWLEGVPSSHSNAPSHQLAALVQGHLGHAAASGPAASGAGGPPPAAPGLKVWVVEYKGGSNARLGQTSYGLQMSLQWVLYWINRLKPAPWGVALDHGYQQRFMSGITFKTIPGQRATVDLAGTHDPY
jgi:hypothetical protein